jgi:hypothetical protein
LRHFDVIQRRLGACAVQRAIEFNNHACVVAGLLGSN